MTEFVLDCSVAMGWCFSDQTDPLTEMALALLRDGTAYVPPLWFLEVSNVLLVAERRHKIKRSEGIQCLEMLRSLPIVPASTPASWEQADRALSIGREYGLSAYDAAYVDLAMRVGLPLATRDRALRAACKRADVRLLTVKGG
jgi:predicted nucleic acid-binding protein